MAGSPCVCRAGRAGGPEEGEAGCGAPSCSAIPFPCRLGFRGRGLCLMRAGNTRPGPVLWWRQLGALPEQEATWGGYLLFRRRAAQAEQYFFFKSNQSAATRNEQATLRMLYMYSRGHHIDGSQTPLGTNEASCTQINRRQSTLYEFWVSGLNPCHDYVSYHVFVWGQLGWVGSNPVFWLGRIHLAFG